MDDAVQVHCSKCKSNFREKARRLQSGYSKQCPRCEIIIFFEEGTSDKSIRKALNDAKNVRRALREDEEAKRLGRAVLRERQTEEHTGEQAHEHTRYAQTSRTLSYFRR